MSIRRVNLVLICGPPGMGKTTLVNTLQNSAFKNAYLVSLSFDAILPTQLEAMLVSSNEWRTGRNMILTLTSILIELLQNSPAVNNPIAFFQTKLDKIIFESPFFTELFENFIKCLNTKDLKKRIADSDEVIILLDDIFYYSSMRQAYYRLAINSQTVAYFSLCLKPTNLKLLNDRNQSRDQSARLPPHIIQNIFTKFEYPDKISWEKAFTHVEEYPSSDNISSELILNGLQAFIDHKQIISKESIRVDKEKQTGSVKTLIHEIDLIIRRLISGHLKDFAGNDKKLKAAELNATKSDILNRLRCLSIPENCHMYFELNELFLRTDFEELETMIRHKMNI